MHWLGTLKEIRAKQIELGTIDPLHQAPAQLPTGASTQAIEDAERRMGRLLPPSYKAFLAMHNGWPEFFQGLSLFGVRELAEYESIEGSRILLDEWDTPVSVPVSEAYPPRSGRTPKILVPFAADTQAESFFAWDPSRRRKDGELEVVLWVGQIGDRIDGFPRLVDLVFDMLMADLEEWKRRTASGRRRRPEARQIDIPAKRVRAA